MMVKLDANVLLHGANHLDDCDNAAQGGNAIKKLLGWPEELCNAVPNRTKKRKKNNNVE